MLLLFLYFFSKDGKNIMYRFHIEHCVISFSFLIRLTFFCFMCPTKRKRNNKKKQQMKARRFSFMSTHTHHKWVEILCVVYCWFLLKFHIPFRFTIKQAVFFTLSCVVSNSEGRNISPFEFFPFKIFVFFTHSALWIRKKSEPINIIYRSIFFICFFSYT